MASAQSYYEDLQVSTDASFAEIRASFRRMARIYHPDKRARTQSNPQETLTSLNHDDLFSRASLAYEIQQHMDRTYNYAVAKPHAVMAFVPGDLIEVTKRGSHNGGERSSGGATPLAPAAAADAGTRRKSRRVHTALQRV